MTSKVWSVAKVRFSGEPFVDLYVTEDEAMAAYNDPGVDEAGVRFCCVKVERFDLDVAVMLGDMRLFGSEGPAEHAGGGEG